MANYKRFLLLAAVLVSVITVPAQVRDSLTLQILHNAKADIDRLIAENPENFPPIYWSSVNEDSLSLEYHVTDDPQRLNQQLDSQKIQTLPNIFTGFAFRFHLDIERPQNNIAPYYSWIGSNVYLSFRRHLPLSRFPADQQAMVTQAFEKACEPLFEMEQRVLTKLLDNHDPYGIILEGSSSMKMLLELNYPTPKLKISAQSKRSANIYSLFDYHLLIGDSLYISRFPQGFEVRAVRMVVGNPMVTLEMGEATYLTYAVIPKLPAGRHRIRIIASVDRDQWTDYGPTIVDGPPVIRKIERSWTGRLISNELHIEVDVDGLITEL
jgi:hypothetical protein